MVQLAFALLKAPLSETAALGSWDQPLLAAACCEQQADVAPEELFPVENDSQKFCGTDSLKYRSCLTICATCCCQDN